MKRLAPIVDERQDLVNKQHIMKWAQYNQFVKTITKAKNKQLTIL